MAKSDKRCQVVSAPPAVLDMSQAAKYLHIPRPSLYVYALAGLVPAAKIGGRWRFHRATLDEWLIAKTKKNLKQVAVALLFLLSLCQPAGAEVRRGTASYYTRQSAIAEGNSGVMANGQQMRDEAFTAASWEYPFGTRIKVMAIAHPSRQTSAKMGRQVVEVTISDRGPSRKLYRQGRLLDLSRAAFQALAPLEKGVIPVVIEEIR